MEKNIFGLPAFSSVFLLAILSLPYYCGFNCCDDGGHHHDGDGEYQLFSLLFILTNY